LAKIARRPRKPGIDRESGPYGMFCKQDYTETVWALFRASVQFPAVLYGDLRELRKRWCYLVVCPYSIFWSYSIFPTLKEILDLDLVRSVTNRFESTANCYGRNGTTLGAGGQDLFAFLSGCSRSFFDTSTSPPLSVFRVHLRCCQGCLPGLLSCIPPFYGLLRPFTLCCGLARTSLRSRAFR